MIMSDTTDTTDTTQYMLTTVDNPYDPWTSFDEWLAFDTMKGYHSLSFLDRVCENSNELSSPDQAYMIQIAIDEIVEENVSGMWRKISKDEGAKLSTSQILFYGEL